MNRFQCFVSILAITISCTSPPAKQTELNVKAYSFLTSNLDSVHYYAGLSIQKHNESEFQFYSYYLIAYAFDKQKNYVEAVRAYYKALELIPETDAYHDHFGRINLNLGRILKVNNQFHSALSHYERALQYILPEYKSHVYYNIAQVYKAMSQEDVAIEYYLKVLDIARVNDDLLGQTKVFNQLGIIYNRLGNYQQGREYFYEIINNADSVDRRYVLSAYHNIAHGFRKQFKLHMAEEFYTKAISVEIDIEDKFLSYMDIGEVLMEMSREKEAYGMLQIALENLVSTEPEPKNLAIYSLLGEVTFSLGMNKEARHFLKLHREKLNEYDEVKTTIQNEFISNNFSKSLDDYWDSHGKKIELILDK